MKPARSKTQFTRLACSLLMFLAAGLIWAANPPDPIMMDGDAAFKAGNYELAIAKHTEALQKRPNYKNAYNGRALAYRLTKDYDRALADFGEALRLKREWFVYYNRGITYQDRGDEDSAIADLTKALKLMPKGTIAETDCLVARAHSWFTKEKFEPAMADLNAAIKIGVDETDAYVLRGVLHKINHSYDRSLADYDKAIALDPTEARSYDAAAFLLSACPAPKYRDANKAVTYATKACELTKWKTAANLETLAAAYAEGGRFDEAIKWQKKAAEIDPDSVSATRLDLYQHKKAVRDLNRTETPIPNLTDIGERIAIKLGQHVNARFEMSGDQPVRPEITPGARLKPDSLSLDFQMEKNGRTLRLTHSFRRTCQARCLARLKGYDTYFETDILPIPVHTTNPELWSDPIDELVLFDLKLIGPKASPPAEDPEAIAQLGR